MKQCEQCLCYDKEYDELRQSGYDTIIIGQHNAQKHYCWSYNKEIEIDIVNDIVNCKHYVPKDFFDN